MLLMPGGTPAHQYIVTPRSLIAQPDKANNEQILNPTEDCINRNRGGLAIQNLGNLANTPCSVAQLQDSRSQAVDHKRTKVFKSRSSGDHDIAGTVSRHRRKLGKGLHAD